MSRFAHQKYKRLRRLQLRCKTQVQDGTGQLNEFTT